MLFYIEKENLYKKLSALRRDMGILYSEEHKYRNALHRESTLKIIGYHALEDRRFECVEAITSLARINDTRFPITRLIAKS